MGNPPGYRIGLGGPNPGNPNTGVFPGGGNRWARPGRNTGSRKPRPRHLPD